jgi:hypothetical protein
MLVTHVADRASCRGNPRLEALESKDVSRKASEPDSASLRRLGVASLSREGEANTDRHDMSTQRSDSSGWLRTAGVDRSIRNLGDPAWQVGGSGELRPSKDGKP